MKKLIIASACILALSTAGAFAQMQPAPGASSEGNVGPGATSGSKHVKKGTTTGTGSGSARSSKGMSANPSSEGNVGPGTNNNMGKQPAEGKDNQMPPTIAGGIFA
jgi:hypothetical protein